MDRLVYNLRNRGKMNCDVSHSQSRLRQWPFEWVGSPPEFNNNNHNASCDRTWWIGVRQGHAGSSKESKERTMKKCKPLTKAQARGKDPTCHTHDWCGDRFPDEHLCEVCGGGIENACGCCQCPRCSICSEIMTDGTHEDIMCAACEKQEMEDDAG